MEAIHINNTLRRIAYVDDTLMASQAGSKDIIKYVTALRAAVGLETAVTERNDAAAFLAHNPGGI